MSWSDAGALAEYQFPTCNGAPGGSPEVMVVDPACPARPLGASSSRATTDSACRRAAKPATIRTRTSLMGKRQWRSAFNMCI